MNEETKAFVSAHCEEDVRQLALRGGGNGVDMPMALQQIQGWQTARTKIPSWAAREGIRFPVHLSMEQCSSELTARYKGCVLARMLEREANSGRPHSMSDASSSFLDLTGGFGVDFYFMVLAWMQSEAQHVRTFNSIYVERNAELSALVRHNMGVLNFPCDVKNTDSIEFLHTVDHASVIFLDPARRGSGGGRVVLLEDCTPNVVALRDELLQKTDWLVLKLSPMLDWHRAVKQLSVDNSKGAEVHIVSVRNECKELLLVVPGERVAERRTAETAEGKVRVCCANWTGSEWMQLWFDDGDDAKVNVWKGDADGLMLVGQWLSEPNASVMKGGCFGLLCSRFGLQSLADNSHLFVGKERLENFPGRQLRVVAVSSVNRREMKALVQGVDRANVSVRNFPMSADELRRRLGVKDGGNVFLFGTTLANGRRVVLRCEG